MCRSMVDIQSATAEISRGKKEEERKKETGQSRMWADAQRDGRPAKYRWRPLRKFRNFIPCTMPQSLADGHCSSAVQ